MPDSAQSNPTAAIPGGLIPNVRGAFGGTVQTPAYADQSTLTPYNIIGLPSGITGKYGFNPTTSVYNATGSSLQALRAALAGASAGTVMARIACCGDSTTAGSLSGSVDATQGAYTNHLRAILSAAGYAVGTGVAPTTPLAAGNPSNGGDSRWTFTGTWVAGTSDGALYYTTTNGGTATFVSDVVGTVVNIYYWDQNGSFTYNIDGAGPITVTPGSTFTVKKITVTGLTSADHTVVITGTAVSGAQAAMFGVEVGPAAGIEFSTFGASGYTAGNYLTSGSSNAWINAVTQYAGESAVPFTIVDLGINDANQSVAVATYIANMKTIVTDLQNAGSAVMLMVPMTPANSSSEASTHISDATWLTFRQAMYTLADFFNILLLDLTDLAGSWAKTNAQGLMGDGFHPNSAGYLLMAQAIYNGIFAA
jgi:lysophospholipase L1-like esterase